MTILARERGLLRVNAVSPGVIDTPWWDAMPPDQKAAIFADLSARTPVGRVGGADDVARTVAFLLADNFMSGHTVACDGGIRLAA